MLRKCSSIAVLAVLGLGALAFQAVAQTARPQMLITWSASKSYTPAFYRGKILPNQQSQITAALEVISAAGNVADISGQTIYWYLNDNLIGGGVGSQRVTFRPYGEAPNSLALRVEIPNYPGGSLLHQITIPLAAPQAAITAAYPQGVFSASPAVLQALAYFFAVPNTSLGFSWTANNQTVSDVQNPQVLQISLPQSTPAGFTIPVTLTAQNADDGTAGTTNITLTYQPNL